MGKQSKRKHKRRSGGGGSGGGVGRHHRPTGLADDPAADPANTGGTGNNAGEEASPVATVVGKIRHGDPRVRHAALAALAGTVYDGPSLSSAAGKPRAGGRKPAGANKAADASDPTLLRALAERLLDPDAPCATAAAGCLSNFVSFYCGGDEAMTAGSSEGDAEVAAEVMAPILLQRMQGSLSALTSMGNQMASPAPGKGAKKGGTEATSTDPSAVALAVEKLWPAFREQWALLSLSLSILSGLIENCPLAVRRTGPNAFPHLLAILSLARSSVEFMRTEGSGVIAAGTEGEKERAPLWDGAANAARALHSLLDDNAALITSLPVGAASAASADSHFGGVAAPSLLSAVSELTSIVQTESLPDMARLHASGSILSLRRVLVLEDETAGKSTKSTAEEQELASALQSCANSVVVPMLHSLFETGDATNDDNRPEQLVAQIIDLSNKLSTIKQDAAMESQIVREVNARKEPARLIARRQKMLKEEREKAKKRVQQQQQGPGEGGMDVEEGKEEGKESSAAMLVEDDASKDDGTAERQQEEEGKLQQEMDDVLQAWRDLVGSRKLALELVANLCSGREDIEEEEEGMYEDDDEHMWDSDDEAQLAAGHAQRDMAQEGAGCTPSEMDTYESMAERHLPEQILAFFGKWARFLPSLQKEESRPPELVAEDVEELLSTCALCLSNVAACDGLPTWETPSAKDSVVLGGNAVAAKNGLQLFWGELVSVLASGSDSSLHATSVMLSLLRAQPPARALVDAPTLDLLFGLLSQPNEGTDSDALLQTHCNVISMLGVLCAEPHPASIDARVCSALLERLRSVMVTGNAESDSVDSARYAIVITHEVLNVLMDTYGSDECHDDVFEREDVLGHFQRSLPGFKRRIKRMSPSVAREEVGVWNETALNASRFIKYKKDG